MANNTFPRDRVILPDFFGKNLSKSQRTQIRIAEAAIAILGTGNGGLEQFRLESVAEAAGVTRPLILHYFQNREKLFYFTVQFIRARLHQFILAALAKTENPTSELRLYIEAHFQWLQRHPLEGRVWILFLHQASTARGNPSESLRDLHEELATIGRARIASFVLLKNVPLRGRREIARNIQDLLTGALISKVARGGVGGASAKRVVNACLLFCSE